MQHFADSRALSLALQGSCSPWLTGGKSAKYLVTRKRLFDRFQSNTVPIPNTSQQSLCSSLFLDTESLLATEILFLSVLIKSNLKIIKYITVY